MGKANQTSAGVSERYSLSLKPFNNTIEYPEAVFQMVNKIQKNDTVSYFNLVHLALPLSLKAIFVNYFLMQDLY